MQRDDPVTSLTPAEVAEAIHVWDTAEQVAMDLYQRRSDRKANFRALTRDEQDWCIAIAKAMLRIQQES